MTVQYLDPLSIFSYEMSISHLGEPFGVGMVSNGMNPNAYEGIFVTVSLNTQNVVGSI